MSKSRAELVERPIDRLSAADRLFVLHYLKHHNGSRAYRASHPAVQSVRASATGAWKLLQKPDVAAAIASALEKQFKTLQMDADEALMLISLDARADLTELFDEHDRILPIHLWPDAVRRSVKRIRQTDQGVDVTMNDSLRARELMAQAGGKLKNIVKHEFDLGRYLGAAPPPGDDDT